LATRTLRNTLQRYRRTVSRRLGIGLASAGLMLERTAKSTSFDALLLRRLRAARKAGAPFFFVQIGANDGVSHDPIHAFVSAKRVDGIVVEPLPDMFEALCHTYRRHPGVRKLNLAIHNELDVLTLYRPDPARAAHLSGIASLRKDRHALTSNRSGLSEADIVALEVPAISLNNLLIEQKVEHLDLLQIDVEGYDMEIVDSLDLQRWRPSIIRFEHGVYSGVPVRDKLRDTLLRLYDHGYAIAMERVDAVAWIQEDLAAKARSTGHNLRRPP
jgi:FkbM family methyltransferase